MNKDEILVLIKLDEFLKSFKFERMEGSDTTSFLCPSKKFLVNVFYTSEAKLNIKLMRFYIMTPNEGWESQCTLENDFEDFTAIITSFLIDARTRFENFYDENLQ